MTNVPAIGRIVHYELAEQDVMAITERRRESASKVTPKPGGNYDTARGNSVQVGDIYPMVITRAWGDTPESAVNGQVLLDGNDTHWVTSCTAGDGRGHFSWPGRR